ncbi:MAG: translocated intimin receptor Tir [Acidobacteria bacterium]|nr:MAG: translocated intimin receptor Tir [Acidobacteriota bacterium]
MPRSRVRAVVTDVHFWVPLVVLVAGATLLLVLGRL